MTWVKVCGLSKPEDVLTAARSGADAIGFVFYPQSPRLVSVDQARELGSEFAGLKVAVTVGLGPGELLALAKEARVDAVQPYGAGAYAAAKAASLEGLKVLFPVVVRGRPDLAHLPDAAVPLLDSSELGGSGATFDWGMARGIGRDFVLAGGLSGDNVGDAIARLHPWGVDASSGLESAPGVKDPAKVAAFVEKAKAQ
ncbi:MAG: phosphoribosylanthranilate isomerase [Acidimicrobiia bacterium]